MTPEQRRYVVGETVISVVINTVISVGFAWLMFGGASSISMRAITLDSIPQSFMITLMSVLVPGFLTLRRLQVGVLAPLPGLPPRWSLPVRAVCAALIAIVAGLAVHAALGTGWVADVGFSTLLAVKIVYGATLAAVVTPFMLRYAMRRDI